MNETQKDEEIEALCDTPEIWYCTVEDLSEIARAYLSELKASQPPPGPDDFEIVWIPEGGR